MLHVLVLLLATLWPPLQMEIRLTPSALQAPTKTKNLTDDFAARRATVAAICLHTAVFRAGQGPAGARVYPAPEEAESQA
jgi:hypothetical protein